MPHYRRKRLFSPALLGTPPRSPLPDGPNGVLPGAKAAAKEQADRGGEVEDLVGLGDSEVALLTVDGRIARVDATDASLLSRLVPANPDPDRAGMGTLDDSFTDGRLLPRPHYPGQVAAVTRRGAAFGDVLLWDLRAPRHTGTLSGRAISASFVTNDAPPTGPRSCSAARPAPWTGT
ncbi:hypothetical protein ACGFYE_38000 [Streptomyces zaomyceticus]|uniref:hypothetical protein n=1 Tax=Streptomyces zaomyceticus TaxID=68286 RepID=UPI00371F14FE